MSSMSNSLNKSSWLKDIKFTDPDKSYSRPKLVTVVAKLIDSSIDESSFMIIATKIFGMNDADAYIAFSEYEMTKQTIMGEYTKDIAETKVSLVLTACKDCDFKIRFLFKVGYENEN